MLRARSPAPTAAMVPPVGARIAVFWPLDNVFYPATIIRALPDKRHTILYDDNHKETLNLFTERFRTLPPASPPPPLPLTPLHPHILRSLTHVPPILPPRKRYSKRYYRSKRSRTALTLPADKISLRIRIRSPALSMRASPPRVEPLLKLPSTKEMLSEVSHIPPSPPTQPQLPRKSLSSQLDTTTHHRIKTTAPRSYPIIR